MLQLVHRSLAHPFDGFMRCSALALTHSWNADTCPNGTSDNARLRGCSRVDWYI